MTSYYLQWESVYLQWVFVFVTPCYLQTEHWLQSASFMMLVVRIGTVGEEVNAAPPALGTSLMWMTVGTGTCAWKSKAHPSYPPTCYLPLHHEDHFWPLIAVTAPQAPPHPHISGLETRGCIDWFETVYLRLAYLSSQLYLHHKKIISCDYLLFLLAPSLFLSLSVLSISTLLRPVVAWPTPSSSANPIHLLVFFLVFSFSSGVEVVNNEGLIPSTASMCVLLCRHSSASCLFTQPC